MANYSDDLEKVYDDMISESEKHYQAQIDASKQWADTQSRLQQERTDFEISQIEREKEQTTKDYKKEQSGAYVDWQKESNRYGTNAEYMASNGLAGSGYSESSQVSMYNTYQNRVTTARNTWTRAIQNYNDKITEARMQNSAALAQIAYQALQQQLELSLASFQYKSQLTEAKAATRKPSGGGGDSYLSLLDDIDADDAASLNGGGDEIQPIMVEDAAVDRTKVSVGGGAAGFDNQIRAIAKDAGVGLQTFYGKPVIGNRGVMHQTRDNVIITDDSGNEKKVPVMQVTADRSKWYFDEKQEKYIRIND